MQTRRLLGEFLRLGDDDDTVGFAQNQQLISGRQRQRFPGVLRNDDLVFTAQRDALGGGLLTGKYRRGESGRANTFGSVVHTESEPRAPAVMDALLAVADELG